MKTLNKLIATGAMAFLLMLMAPHKSMAQEGYVSDQEFYDNLQQYGTWVQDDQYGDVWVPDVDDNFRPYATNGYWVQTDYGTTWVSDYPWGWATFHYGRWRYDDYYGWEWIPGHEWAPAWVSWRQGGGYYGWAPMGPGISISISLGGGGYTDNRYWVYAPQRYITSRYINRYYAPPTRVNIIVRNTTYIRNTYVYNNRTYITGPRPAEIQRVTHRQVNVYKINDAPRPGGVRVDANVINIYRPNIQKTPDARPARVVSATAYKNDHPNEGIGKRGGIGYNRGNAVKLASAARTDKPDGRVVRVNPKPNEANRSNNPASNNPAIRTDGHNRNNEPKNNPAGQPNAPQQGDRRNQQNPTVNQPQQGNAQKPQTGGNEPVRPGEGRNQHRTVPTASQPQQPNQQPAQQQGNQPTQQGQADRHQRGHNPAVNPPAQNNTDKAQRQQQQQAAEQQRQQAEQQQKEQQQQAQQAARQQQQQAQQQQKEQQQQAQQQERQQAQQQQRQQQQQAQQQAKQQQQQAQQASRQQAQQQQRQQQQQAQQAAQQQRQQAQQQQRQQQQQARQQAQQQQRQQQQQAEQQRKQQEEQQKEKQNPPR